MISDVDTNIDYHSIYCPPNTTRFSFYFATKSYPNRLLLYE